MGRSHDGYELALYIYSGDLTDSTLLWVENYITPVQNHDVNCLLTLFIGYNEKYDLMHTAEIPLNQSG